MTTRRARTGFVPIGNVDLAGGAIPARRARELALHRAWVRAAGEQLARRARPLRIVRGVLEIEVADPRWGQVLDGLIPSLAARMAAADPSLGIRRFRIFRHGHTAGENRPVAIPLPDHEEPEGAAERRVPTGGATSKAGRSSIGDLASAYLGRNADRRKR
jgi:hypothetical protein